MTASTSEMDDEWLIDGGPKLRAGNRTVAFPADIVPELAGHGPGERSASPDCTSMIVPTPALCRPWLARPWSGACQPLFKSA